MTASIPLLVTFAAYLLLMIGIGLWAFFRTRTFDDYILGGRSLGSYVTALSAGASDMSGWLLMGLPGALYATGLAEAWIAIGLTIGAWLNWRFVAGPLRVYTERSRNALTLPDYFTHRFADDWRILRLISALVILVFFAVYCASGIVAGARLFESVFGVPYAYALWLGAAATILYTLVGGFLAVSWTDTVQATLMIFALLLVPVMVVVSNGGLDSSFELIRQVDPSRLQWVGAGGVIGVISAAAWGLGYFGQPHILARFMAADSLKTIPQARRIGMTWMILCLGGAISVGLFGIGYYQANPQSAGMVNANSERVFIALAEQLFNPWVAGVLLSAILAAVMSTLSCQLLVCSSALTEDFYKGFIRKQAGQTELVWVGRAMVLAVALVAIVIAWDPESRVLGLVSYAWAGFGAAFGPVVLLSLFWRRMTRNGALAGVVAGALVVVLWKVSGNVLAAWQAAGDALVVWKLAGRTAIDWGMTGNQLYASVPEGIRQALALYEIVPGFVAAALAVVAVSLLGRAPPAQVQATHDEVRAELRANGY
ncbi:sodium/proline symporter PutP [Pseudoxanthomonas wuyuanensis]|uniref:Sodium/proline symporter n=1 Tax=Pseudoxanthomonas wuyuanensis TaxID=1073196 RepID=A0A286DE92_9GAMM|nr:sodium/proline symporter PutP [Pseudoxanthomonas wuyuanensis]KAF1720050.1 sodium/proline symporter PutP [Pseudoxanthomonas wuyuanensis]SOD56964.1 sodium/proline symporter [Pseudoxanthomonas wuyuanensis]